MPILYAASTLNMYIIPNYYGQSTVNHPNNRVRMLSAGFHEYHDTTGDFEEMDREQVLKTIFNQKLLFKPGDQEAYSNSGYTLLAAIIEHSSKQSNKSFL
jgi:hypothetical protein